MARTHFTYATRKSALALAQCRALVAVLAKLHPDFSFEELQVVTTGDRMQDRALSEIGGKGLFIKEIEEALLDGRADFAVHSSKDVPPELAPSLSRGVFPGTSGRARRDRDSLGRGLRRVARGLDDWHFLVASPHSAQRLAPRSAVFDPARQRRHAHSQVPCGGGRGDRAWRAPACFGWASRAKPVKCCLPSARCRQSGKGRWPSNSARATREVSALLAPVSHPETKIAVLAERGVMRAVEGNCQTPVAAYAVREGSRNLAARPARRARRLEFAEKRPARALAQHDSEATALGEALGRSLRS